MGSKCYSPMSHAKRIHWGIYNGRVISLHCEHGRGPGAICLRSGLRGAGSTQTTSTPSTTSHEGKARPRLGAEIKWNWPVGYSYDAISQRQNIFITDPPRPCVDDKCGAACCTNKTQDINSLPSHWDWAHGEISYQPNGGDKGHDATPTSWQTS
ncbi:hypothetical protein GQ53DRAFT_17094 [Thozetella sp. PMI_491]|nr:hypothetical protein GQ53DRAFT_17094 [Thozetella sp. PMI_491]